MNLPKPKNKKLINIKKYIETARKVQKSLKEEQEYLLKKNIQYGNTLSSNIINFT